MFGRSKIPTLKVPKQPAPEAQPQAAETSSGESAGAPKLPASAKAAAGANNKKKDRSDEFYELKTRVHKKLVETLDLAEIGKRNSDDIKEEVRQIIAKLCDDEDVLLNFNEKQQIVTEILNETFGLGPLEAILTDPHVSDILINGPKQVYVERKGRLEKSTCVFKDDAHLMHVIDKIVSSVGRRCDEVSPMVDARLKDGSRVNAIIPPLAIDGASMSIRRFGTDPITWDDYIRYNSVTKEMCDFLKACVLSHMNIIVVGGTGSGKTTLLNNLSSFIPDTERIVTIEDSAELQLRQPHIVRLETRPPNIEGKGQVAIRDLLINSLRMRPDRIVVGECRGAETLDMLQAMNTGHDGSLTTIHANSVRDAVQRVETMVMMAGFDLPIRAIRNQFASAVHLLINANRLTGGPRKVMSIAEVQGMEGEAVTIQEIFKFEQLGIDATGKAYGQFIATGLRPGFLDRLKYSGVEMDPALFERRVLSRDPVGA
ncbi:MAG: CpaF family protein [Phycisphaerales bacterium]|nr:CpaF family protein [Phycisphaerales bacterium]MCB9857955.1 CpaF family protein [Phycisphaerales bacterium]